MTPTGQVSGSASPPAPRPPAMRFGRIERPDPTRPATTGQPPEGQSMIRRGFDRLFRNPATGAIVIVQAPNPALGLFAAVTLARLLVDPQGAVGTALAVTGTVALAWWAGSEVLRGESLFRRLLGGVVLVTLVAGRLIL